MPPEVLNKEASGKAVDWWCLGNIIFEMATGLPPFYSTDRSKVAEKIRHGEPVYPIDLSSRLKSLLKELLIKDPAKRIGSKSSSEIREHPWFSKVSWSEY